MVSQLDALHATIEALGLRDEHSALVAYCEGLAEVIDEHPERATLWREYRPALEILARVGETNEDDGSAQLLELVRTPIRHEADAK